MSKSTISTFELFRMFPDQESARVYFEARAAFQAYQAGAKIAHKARVWQREAEMAKRAERHHRELLATLEALVVDAEVMLEGYAGPRFAIGKRCRKARILLNAIRGEAS